MHLIFLLGAFLFENEEHRGRTIDWSEKSSGQRRSPSFVSLGTSGNPTEK